MTGLPGLGGAVQCLPDRLVQRLGVESQQRAKPGRDRRTEVRDAVDLVLVQADALHQVDLHLGRRDRAH
jgi:hypothetical protein